MIGTALLIVFPLCMVFAAIYDVFTLRIPNVIIVILLVAFIVFAPLAGMGWENFAWHFAIGIAFLIGGFLLYSFGKFGAGDVKLLSVSTLWFGPALFLPYVLWTGILGGVLAIAILMLRGNRLRPVAELIPAISHLLDKDKGIPYGAAMGPAAIGVFTQSPWMNFVIKGTLLG